MVCFLIFLLQNLIQNARNCTILKTFSGGGGHAPNPPSKAHATCKLPNLKRNIRAHPLPNHGYAPDFEIILNIKWLFSCRNTY